MSLRFPTALVAVFLLAGCQTDPLPENRPVAMVAASEQPSQGNRPICGPRPFLLAQLKSKYSESPKSMGLAANGSVLEVLTSVSGTWTILLTTPSGITCLIAAGEHWEEMAVREGEDS